MTRQQIIQHLAAVAMAVFRAEVAVKPQWQQRLDAAKDADPDTRQRTADEYFQAIAGEMLKSYSDEELQRLYNEE